MAAPDEKFPDWSLLLSCSVTVSPPQVTEPCTSASTFLWAERLGDVTVTEDTDTTGNDGTAQTGRTDGSLRRTVRPDSDTESNHTQITD